MNRPADPRPDPDAGKPEAEPPRESDDTYPLADLDDPTQAGVGGAGVGLDEIEKGVATPATPEPEPADPDPPR